MSLINFVQKTMQYSAQVGKDIKQLRGWLGNLAGLNTTHKTTIVGAINEVKDQVLNVQQNQSNYIPLTQKGAPGGVAELDAGGMIPAAQLPSFVDDVLEGFYSAPTIFRDAQNNAYLPETGKVYVDISAGPNKGSWRWSGTQYSKVEVDGLILGTTSTTAGRGDHTAAAYAHISDQANPHNVTAAQVGLGNVPNHSYATTAVANAGTSSQGLMNPKLTKDAVDSWVGTADPHQEYLNNL